MKDSPSALLETRTETLLRHVGRYLRARRISHEDFALDVHRCHLERTPEAALEPKDFPLGGSAFHVQEAGGQKLRRWVNPAGGARPSLDMEESIVFAMEQPWRNDCLRDMDLRVGGIFVALPDEAMPAMGHAGELLLRVSDALKELAPLFADGRLDATDDEAQLRSARAELVDLASETHRLIALIDAAMGQKQALARIGGAK